MLQYIRREYIGTSDMHVIEIFTLCNRESYGMLIYGRAFMYVHVYK